MNKNILAPLVLTISISFLTACGGNGGGSSKSSANNDPAIQEQLAEGSYLAILRPMNNSLSGFLPSGTADIRITGDTFQVKSLLDDDAKVSHIQSIHVGSRCPNLSDDTNGDGLVDIQESYAVAGSILLPLDSDLNSAIEGSSTYPLGGGFTYMESASLSKLESDVMARTAQNLNLGGRVVLIHGVAANTNMPSTVATRDNMTSQASVPIACGILKRY